MSSSCRATGRRSQGVRTLDMAKRLLDFGIHPPTVYFPLIVEECMMIEPTETGNQGNAGSFYRCDDPNCQGSGRRIRKDLEAPHHTPVKRLDEVTAARKPVLRWQKED